MWQRAVHSMPGEQKLLISRPSASPHLRGQQAAKLQSTRCANSVRMQEGFVECGHHFMLQQGRNKWGGWALHARMPAQMASCDVLSAMPFTAASPPASLLAASCSQGADTATQSAPPNAADQRKCAAHALRHCSAASAAPSGPLSNS